MKALTKITAAAIIAIFQLNMSVAETRFEMYVDENTSIEVVSKEEMLVEENLPVINDAICKSRSPKEFVLKFEVKEEMPVQEELPEADYCNKQVSDEYMVTLVRSLVKPEKEVDDLDFDTKAVVEEYKSSLKKEITSQDIKKFSKPEYEVLEDAYVHYLTVYKAR